MQATTTTTKIDIKHDGWKTKLMTHEDPWHVHKILGLSCLISFAWRLAHVGESDMGFRSHPHWTIPTILLHLSLTLSSFIFHIPAKRIKSGDRIWPEYRLHALVFLSRSLALCGLYYYEQQYEKEPNYNANFAIVMLTLLAADVSSWSVGDQYSSGSIRNLSAHPAVKFYFSVMQFGATAGCLYGLRRFSLQFYMCFIVQINPFLMTLRRKNLVSKSVIVTLYGLGLAGGVALVFYEHTVHAPNGFNSFYCQGVLVNLAALLRLGPRTVPVVRMVQDNKYVMWFSLGLLLRHMRSAFDDPQPLSKRTIVICQFLRISMFALGIWKGFVRDRMRSTRIADESFVKKAA